MIDVIFRETMTSFGEGFMAVFPEDPANRGELEIITFCFDQYDRPIFEPYGAASLQYVLNQKIIHKNDERIPKLVEAIEERVGDKVVVKEKINYDKLDWY